MKDSEMLYVPDNTEAELYCDNLIYAASAGGQICMDRIQELAKYPEITEGKLIGVLCEIRDSGADILPYRDYPFGREHYNGLLENIRRLPQENEYRAANRAGEDPIKLYFDEIECLPVLSGNDERDLIFDIADGDEDKKEMLIEGCMFIPAEAAYQYIGHDMLYLDLVQEGNMELMAAAEEFDYNKNISFIAYASFRVNRKLIEITDSAVETLRIPSDSAESIAGILDANKKSMEENGRELTDKELSEKLDLPPEKIKAAKEVLERFNR